MAGERCDNKTMEWLQRNFLGVFINDTYWQTESGLFICSNYKNYYQLPFKMGSCTKPCPGFVVHILDDNGEIVGPEVSGRVCIKLPLPPGFAPTLWKNDNGFFEKYLSPCPGKFCFDFQNMMHRILPNW